MTIILPQYSGNVPTGKTSSVGTFTSGQSGGKCNKPCANCQAYQTACIGCDDICPDNKCPADKCLICSMPCGRHPEINNRISEINGFEIDKEKTGKSDINFQGRFIAGINKRPKFDIDYHTVSIPFYAIYDFGKQKVICNDVKDYFKLSDKTKVLINFYFKDDKILAIYDMIKSGEFWDIVRSVKGIDFWHSVNFSVYDVSSSMDVLLNFKRQFWVADMMRDKGLKVIQESIVSLSKKNIKADYYTAIDIIKRKKIDFIGINCQLINGFNDILLGIIPFLRKLRGIPVLISGFDIHRIDAVKAIYSNSYFMNYAAFYKSKSKSEYHKTINEVNANIK